MAKYNSDASVATSTTGNNSGNGFKPREKAVAWGNFTFRLKDGASSQMGLPFMMSDYVQRTIVGHMKKQATDADRKELFKKLICKAIDNGDFDFRFITERNEDEVGELDI